MTSDVFRSQGVLESFKNATGFKPLDHFFSGFSKENTFFCVLTRALCPNNILFFLLTFVSLQVMLNIFNGRFDAIKIALYAKKVLTGLIFQKVE